MDEKSSTYDPSIALWNCIFPIEESASKSGKTSPRFTMVIFFKCSSLQEADEKDDTFARTARGK